MRFALGTVLVLLVPPLLATGAETPGAVTALAVVALTAVLALLVAGTDLLATRSPVVVRLARGDVPPELTGRATDPTHHPLRPRAPGQA